MGAKHWREEEADIERLEATIKELRQQLAAANAEIERLKEILMYELEYQLNNGNEVSKFAGSYLATAQEKL